MLVDVKRICATACAPATPISFPERLIDTSERVWLLAIDLNICSTD
jgi:hypothetical protein